MAENYAKIESEITELVTDLYEAFDADHGSTVNESEALDRYVKRVARIGLLAGKEGLVSLQDVCFVYRQLLINLREQNHELSNYIRERLELWPLLAMSLLSGTISDELYEDIVDFFEDTVWPEKLSYDDVAFLRSEIRTSVEPEIADGASLLIQTVPENEGISLREDSGIGYTESYLTIPYDNMTLEALQQEVLEAMADLLVDISDNSEGQIAAEFSDSLHLCADRTELVGITVATMGFMGLMDTCQYFQYSLRELAGLDIPIDESLVHLLEQWPSMVIGYLTSPGETENVDEVVEYIKSIPWTPELLEEESSSLKEQLLENCASKNNDVNTSEDFQNHDVNSAIDSNRPNDLSWKAGNIKSHSDESENKTSSDSSVVDSFATCGPDNELINIVKIEIEANLSLLQQYLLIIFDSNQENENKIEAANNYKALIDRFKLAAESIGLTGLAHIFENITRNIDHSCSTDECPDANIFNVLDSWPLKVVDYLGGISDLERCSKLAELFVNQSLPVETHYSHTELSAELSNPLFLYDEEAEQRQTEARPEDVSLELPEDVNHQLLDTLLQELPGQTAQFTAAISRLVEGKANLQVVEVAQRIAHTLKGSANTVGVKGIASITHHLEDILTAFEKHNRMPAGVLAEVMMSAADVLEAMSEALLGLGPAPDNARRVLQDILDWANRIDRDGISEIDDGTKIPSTVNEAINEDQTEQGFEARDSYLQPMLRIPAELMDDLLRILGESLTLGGQLQEQVQQLNEQVKQEQEQNKLLQQLCFELEQITDIKGIVTRDVNGTYNEVFDTLELDQYNELHTITHRLVEASTDAKELTLGIEDGLSMLSGLILNQDRLQKETQDVVMRTRMVAVQNIVPRLQRAVRQTCRFTGKQASLEVFGVDTLIDSDILNDLVDPLMHVIRNAIDHGIESSDVRSGKGKDAKGIISLRFGRNGDRISIECRDDGAGLDFEAIKEQAIIKDLISSEQFVSEEELTRLIWLPGFTTKDQTTQISGRGIGMDAVYNQVAAMKGTLNIASLQDAGTTIEIQLPLSLISMHTLLVSAYNQDLAISTRGIEQILPPGDGSIVRKGDNMVFCLDEEEYELIDLESLLNVPFNRENTERTVLLVRDETGMGHAVSLDKVVASRDVVVKQLGQFLPKVAGIEGATILGDGSVAPVIDLPSLLRTTADKYINPWIEQLEEAGAVTDAPYALIVDDSLRARRSLAEYVKDLGYQILTAKDGIEAIEIIDSRIPDIILVDFEMPRMNGVELTAHVRADERTKGLPIIMITSRATEKHQAMATSAGVDIYLTKPYSEDALMGHIHKLFQENRRTA